MGGACLWEVFWSRVLVKANVHLLPLCVSWLSMRVFLHMRLRWHPPDTSYGAARLLAVNHQSASPDNSSSLCNTAFLDAIRHPLDASWFLPMFLTDTSQSASLPQSCGHLKCHFPPRFHLSIHNLFYFHATIYLSYANGLKCMTQIIYQYLPLNIVHS